MIDLLLILVEEYRYAHTAIEDSYHERVFLFISIVTR